MNPKVILSSLSVLIVIIGVNFFFWTTPVTVNSSPANLPVLAITQIIEHPSLDQEREGIIQALNKAGYIDGKNIKIIYQNAQGNMATAAQIVTQLLSYKPKVMVAISTPSAQAALAPCLNQKIPLVFTAVTDPLAAKLVKNITARTESVTGVSDALAVSSQIQLIKRIVPNIKTLGVIYNAGEENSTQMILSLKTALATENITLIEATASKTSDITAAANTLIGKVQAIYIPNDNTAVAAIKSIALIAERHKLPLIAGDAGAVEMGAIATYGYDRRALGEKAADLIIQILQGAEASALPILTEHSLTTFINMQAADRMGVILPPDFIQSAKIIGK